MNKIFFFLYNYYYKNGNPDPRMDPIPQTSTLFAVCIAVWIVFFDLVFSYILKYKVVLYIHGIVAASIGLICGGLIHTYYLDTNRITKLYRKYKLSLTPKKIRIGTLFSFIFIISPFLLSIFWEVIVKIFLE